MKNQNNNLTADVALVAAAAGAAAAGAVIAVYEALKTEKGQAAVAKVKTGAATAAGKVKTGAVTAAGKVKTAATMVGLCVMMTFPQLQLVNGVVVGVIVITTVYSGVEYFIQNWNCLWD